MTLKDFIFKAIEGGWNPSGERVGRIKGNPISLKNDMFFYEDPEGYQLRENISKILLDPLAWQATGKVVPWDGKYFHNEARDPYYALGYDPENCSWKMNMHRMIDALAEGRTIVDFLDTL